MVSKWDRHHLEMLIERVRTRTCIWDTKDPDYRKSYKKRDMFEEIAAEIDVYRPGTTADDVKKRWTNLRSQFTENIRSINRLDQESSPDTTKETNKAKTASKLWCKEQLTFLSDVTTPRSKTPRKSVESPDDEVSVESIDPGDSPESCCYQSIHSGESSGVPRKQRKTSEPSLGSMCAPLPDSPGIAPLLPPHPNYELEAIDRYAHFVASELRLIRQPQQLLLAKLQIHNILFQAQCGQLVLPPSNLTFPGIPFSHDAMINWAQGFQVMNPDGISDKGT